MLRRTSRVVKDMWLSREVARSISCVRLLAWTGEQGQAAERGQMRRQWKRAKKGNPRALGDVGHSYGSVEGRGGVGSRDTG